MARFEAVYHEEEPDERSADWVVVEWTHVNPANGAKSGRKVESFGPYGEAEAKEMAELLQHDYNLSFAEHFA